MPRRPRMVDTEKCEMPDSPSVEPRVVVLVVLTLRRREELVEVAPSSVESSSGGGGNGALGRSGGSSTELLPLRRPGMAMARAAGAATAGGGGRSGEGVGKLLTASFSHLPLHREPSCERRRIRGEPPALPSPLSCPPLSRSGIVTIWIPGGGGRRRWLPGVIIKTPISAQPGDADFSRLSSSLQTGARRTTVWENDIAATWITSQ
ncbi:uncharacterized protein LOC132710815 [Pantherophis guttatus]|uniref:Uncharacterized protein LOC132710815 n=1 Tax=Pantherophis guttatus TaxID=94885 RepID=A0ABM3Z6U3_PANGU|nr:uncharacterized protein LOC132710815 [Pantherophis guttatus]